MIKKIKSLLVVSAASLVMFAPALVSSAVSYAACDNIQNGIASGVTSSSSDATTCDSSGNADITSGVSSLAAKIVNIFSIVVGIIAVIMIIYGGFKYITSGGDSNNVSGAKNTLIYAIIGLVIVALAQLIVHYVLNTAAGVSSSSS